MNKNKNKINLIWIAIIFLAIGIVVGFLVSLNTSKTGDAMKAISNSKVGAEMKITDNFSIKKTQDGAITTYIQSYEDEKEGKIVTEKISTLTTEKAQVSCVSKCGSHLGGCILIGCDPTSNGECTSFSCENDAGYYNPCSGGCGQIATLSSVKPTS